MWYSLPLCLSYLCMYLRLECFLFLLVSPLPVASFTPLLSVSLSVFVSFYCCSSLAGSLSLSYHLWFLPLKFHFQVCLFHIVQDVLLTFQASILQPTISSSRSHQKCLKQTLIDLMCPHLDHTDTLIGQSESNACLHEGNLFH